MFSEASFARIQLLKEVVFEEPRDQTAGARARVDLAQMQKPTDRTHSPGFGISDNFSQAQVLKKIKDCVRGWFHRESG